MPSRPILSLALLILLLAAIGALAWPAPDPGAPRASATEPAAAAAPEITEPAITAGAADTSQRRAVERAPTASPAAAAQGVRGLLVDEWDRPVAGAAISLFQHGADQPLRRWLEGAESSPSLALAAAESRLDGSFALSLREGEPRQLELCVLAPGFAAERLFGLVVQEGAWVDVGTMKLLPGCTIRGRVTVAGADLPAPQATVTLESGDPFLDRNTSGLGNWQERRTATTDADGRYELRHAPRQGLFRLAASAPGFGRQVADSVALQGNGVVEQDFALPRGLSIRGRLQTAGRPLGPVRITAFSHKPEPAHVGEVSADGRFYIHGLAEGPHLVQIRAEGFQPVDLADIEAGSPERIVPLAERGRAAVRVRDAAGAIVRQYRLAVRRSYPEAQGQLGLVRDAPERLVRLGVGEERATFDGLDDGVYVFEVEAAGFAATRSPVFELAADRREAEVEVTLCRGGGLRLQVVDERGRPVADALVRTQPDGADEDNPMFRLLTGLVPDRITRKEARTKADGWCELTGLAHAPYQVEIRHPDFCGAVRRGLVIAEDRTETLPAVTLAQGCLVRGRAVVEGLPGAQVRVVLLAAEPAGPDDPQMRAAERKSPDETSVVRVEVVTNPDGAFELPRRIPAGAYELRGVALAGSNPTDDAFAKLLQLKKSAVRIEIHPGQFLLEQDLRIAP